jgi:hypothetical protein
MTGILNQITIESVRWNPYDAPTSALDGIAVALTLGLLITQTLVRASDDARAHEWQKTLSMATTPLTILFGCIVTVRLVALLFL